VTRVHDSSVVSGSPVAPEAYASYLQGRLLELAGRRNEAEQQYLATIARDDRAHEAYSRLGALRCKSNPESARQAFEKAEALAPRSIALWQTRATCALSTRQPALAHECASQAFRLAPDDPRSGHLLILSQLQNRLFEQARSTAWAHVSRFPRDTLGWQLVAVQLEGTQRLALLSQAARRTRSEDAEHLTQVDAELEQVLAALRAPNVTAQLPQAHAECALTDAFYRHDAPAVAKAARSLTLSSLRLTQLARTRGAYQEAFTEAHRAAMIAPTNAEAWVLALTLADLLGKEDELAQLLSNPPEPTSPISLPVTRLLAELVARRVPLVAPLTPETSTTPSSHAAPAGSQETSTTH
jgi:tetratricopeptide (TPR) repeat protein